MARKMDGWIMEINFFLSQYVSLRNNFTSTLEPSLEFEESAQVMAEWDFSALATLGNFSRLFYVHFRLYFKFSFLKDCNLII